jgi:hypothetical protein
MSLPRLHVAIHGRPAGAALGETVSIHGCRAAILTSDHPLAQTPLPVTFEEAEASLGRLPRLYFEPDGSFGWFAPPDAPRWEIGGMLYDRGDRLMYAELNGACPAAEFRQMLAALGQQRAPLVIQVVEQAVFFDAEDFCRLLETAR